MIGKRMKKKGPRPRAGKAVVIALAILILGLGIAVLIMYLINQQPSKAGGQIDTSEDSSDKWNEGTISYHGKQYKYNQYLKTFLFMGIDNDQPVLLQRMESVEDSRMRCSYWYRIQKQRQCQSSLCIVIQLRC